MRWLLVQPDSDTSELDCDVPDAERFACQSNALDILLFMTILEEADL